MPILADYVNPANRVTEVLALVTSGSDGQEKLNTETSVGSVADGSDLMLDQHDLRVYRIRVRNNGNDLVLNRRGTEDFGMAFSEDHVYEHAEVVIQTDDAAAVFGNDTLDFGGGGYLRYRTFDSGMLDVLASLTEGTDFLFAIRRPGVAVQRLQAQPVAAVDQVATARVAGILRATRAVAADRLGEAQFFDFPRLQARPIRAVDGMSAGRLAAFLRAGDLVAADQVAASAFHVPQPVFFRPAFPFAFFLQQQSVGESYVGEHLIEDIYWGEHRLIRAFNRESLVFGPTA